MPRDGANIYTRPAGTDGVPNATILSAAYNVYVADIEVDLNAPRPVVAGGTGGTSPITARAQLGTEVSSLSQIVTNYDAQVWESGSFLSFVGATAAPTPTDNYAGVCVLMTGEQGNIYLHATNFTTGEIYVRRKNAGTWGPWVLGADQSKLGLAGGTMTGSLEIKDAVPAIYLNDTTLAGARIQYYLPTTNIGWELAFNNTNFQINRFDPAGTYLGAAISINRTGDEVTVNGLGAGNVDGPANTFCVAHAPFRYGITIQNVNINSYPMLFNGYSGTPCGNIFVGTTTTAYNTTCDARLKDDMQPLHIAGDLIDRTRVYDFHWKGTEERGKGVLAQEAAEVFPDAFTYDAISDWWGVDYSKYVPLLIAELQALRKRVAELEAVRR